MGIPWQAQFATIMPANSAFLLSGWQVRCIATTKAGV